MIFSFLGELGIGKLKPSPPHPFVNSEILNYSSNNRIMQVSDWKNLILGKSKAKINNNGVLKNLFEKDKNSQNTNSNIFQLDVTQKYISIR